MIEYLSDKKKSSEMFGGFTSVKPIKALEWASKRLDKLPVWEENLKALIEELKAKVAEEGDEKLDKIANKYTLEELEALIERKKNTK